MRRPVWVLAFTICLSACQGVPDQAWQPESPVQPIFERSERLVLEISDEGEFWSPAQFAKLKDWLETRSPTDPVLVFVHGWHHNAQPDDPNFLGFDRFLAKVEQDSLRPIDGIYVGWRGDSLDIAGLPEPSDFLTIWSRKDASVRVGSGALKALLDYLRSRHGDRQVFVIGHSLGGSAVFYAVKASLQNAALDGFEYVLLNPAVGSSEFEDAATAVTGLRDAYRKQTLDMDPEMAIRLDRSHRKLVVLQSMGDRPVKWGYRIAFAGTPVGFDERRLSHKGEVCTRDEGCGWMPGECTLLLDEGRFRIQTITRASDSCDAVNRRPVWVVGGRDSVSRSHNDVLNDVQASALADLASRYLLVQ